MQENNKKKEKTFFSCFSYNFDLEKFFFYFTNQLYFMSKNKTLFAIEKISYPSLNFDKQYFVQFNFYPFYTAIICDKIEENSSFIKRVNRIYHVQNKENVSFQIIYTFYDNTCENKINSQIETTLFSKVSKREFQLYRDFITLTKRTFSHYLKNFYKENGNEVSYLYESIIINNPIKKLYNYLKNIDNILKLYYLSYNYKWKKLNNNTTEVINHETKIKTIFTMHKISKISNECINFEIKKELKKENEMDNISYVTYFKINPISKNLCWLCCDYPIPFGTTKPAIQNMTSVCKFIIKKIKQNLENNNQTF